MNENNKRFNHLIETFERELINRKNIEKSKPYKLYQANLVRLRSSYIESYNEHVEEGLSLFDGLFNELNELVPIPKTIKAFNEYCMVIRNP